MEKTILPVVKISVVIPAYNAALYIDTTLRSVIKQSFPDFEIIVVDDGSVDETEKIVQTFRHGDLRIQYFYQKNGGVSSARNLGIRKAKGEFISFWIAMIRLSLISWKKCIIR